jgi:hypothetical protein
MFLILAQYDDQLARRVYELLCQKHGPKSTRLLSGDDLAIGTRWTLHQEGTLVRTEMHWADGQLSSDSIKAVFNRLRFVTVPQFVEAGTVDREYAVLEMHAFLLSWLSSLNCVVVNRPNPRSLSGELRGTAELLLLAGRAGLVSRGMRFTSSARRFPLPDYEPLVPIDGAGLLSDTALTPTAKSILGSSPVHFLEPIGSERRRVLVLGDETYGDEMPAGVRNHCMKLARQFGTALVAFTFAKKTTGGDWVFCNADFFPPDLEGNEAEQLARLLEIGTSRPSRS